MPELRWDPFDFFYCLEVEPEIEEPWKTRYDYYIRRDDLVLKLTVWPLESVIALSLRQSHSDKLLLNCALFVHGKARYINDKRGEYLSFENCLIAPFRHSRIKAEEMWEQAKPNWEVELSIKPSIQIRYLD